jgi:hypothetical protein
MALPVRNQRTEVARWDPFAEVQRLRSELSRFFEGLDEVSPLLGDGFIPLAERKDRERVGVLRRRTRSVGRFRYEIFVAGRGRRGRRHRLARRGRAHGAGA